MPVNRFSPNPVQWINLNLGLVLLSPRHFGIFHTRHFENNFPHKAFWKWFYTEGIVLNAIMIHLWLVKCCLSGLVLTHLEAFCLYFHLGRGEGTPWCVGGGWHLSLVGGGTSPPNATTISTNLPPINDEQRWDFHQKYFSSTHLLDFQTHHKPQRQNYWLNGTNSNSPTSQVKSPPCLIFESLCLASMIHLGLNLTLSNKFAVAKSVEGIDNIVTIFLANKFAVGKCWKRWQLTPSNDSSHQLGPTPSNSTSYSSATLEFLFFVATVLFPW